MINLKRGKLFYTYIFENIGKNKNETSSSKNCVHEKKRIFCMLSKKKSKNKNSKLSKDGLLSYYFYFFAFVANDASLPS